MCQINEASTLMANLFEILYCGVNPNKKFTILSFSDATLLVRTDAPPPK